MKYTTEQLDLMTELVFTVKNNLSEFNCSFDEACDVVSSIRRKLLSNELTMDSLKTSLPTLLNEVRRS